MIDTHAFEKLVKVQGLKRAMGTVIETDGVSNEANTMFLIALAAEVDGLKRAVGSTAKFVNEIADHVADNVSAGGAQSSVETEDGGQGRPQDATPFPSGLSTTAAAGGGGGQKVTVVESAAKQTVQDDEDLPPGAIPKPDVVSQQATNPRSNTQAPKNGSKEGPKGTA